MIIGDIFEESTKEFKTKKKFKIWNIFPISVKLYNSPTTLLDFTKEI